MPPPVDANPVRLTGEYAAGDSPFQPVVLTRLARDHCRASLCGEAPQPGTKVAMWIGALGPLGATVGMGEKEGVWLRFHTSLPRQFVSHFVGANG